MTNKPKSCPICGYYLTIAAQFAGYRCVDASHWQAAGLITPHDYYLMAKIAAWAPVERRLRPKSNPKWLEIVKESIDRPVKKC